MSDKEASYHVLIQETIMRCQSAAMGAVLTSLTMTPLDVIRIRMQAQTTPITSGCCFHYHNGLMDHLCVACPNHATNPPWYKRQTPRYRTARQAGVHIFKTEGVMSLWSGLLPTLGTAVPGTVIYYSLYDGLKYKLGYDEAKSHTRHFAVLAAMLSRTATVLVISPIEMVRTKAMSEMISYSRIFKLTKEMVARNGYTSLWRGVLPTLCRDVPFSAIYWFSYESLKSRILNHFSVTQATSSSSSALFASYFVAGAMSGITASTITHPLDVVKTRVQIELTRERVTFSGMAKQIYEHNGVRGLYSGIMPRLMKIAPACAIMISSFEIGKTYFGRTATT